VKREHTAYISLGSNLGDRGANLAEASTALENLDDVRILAASSIYETQPWGVAEQPWYANQVLAAACRGWSAGELLAACKEIESSLGREEGARFGPRIIDLDLLLFNDQVIQEDDLIVPHPRMRQRAFVMVPLVEIAPRGVFPDREPFKQALKKILHHVDGDKIFQD
jgi:2-amino-4-hydroxy-6-hydroxymethyldihydropteridine diphosphokinase